MDGERLAETLLWCFFSFRFGCMHSVYSIEKDLLQYIKNAHNMLFPRPKNIGLNKAFKNILEFDIQEQSFKK